MLAGYVIADVTAGGFATQGDFNVAHTVIDIKNAKSNENSAGFYIEERNWMTEFLGKGGVRMCFANAIRERRGFIPGGVIARMRGRTTWVGGWIIISARRKNYVVTSLK